MNKHFLISVVIPVYNTEKYLEEAIDSVIGQTIGFEENIQIILVNDGSTDGSDVICKSYAQKYHENIIYCDLGANYGVSYVRNRGKELATGKYINFFDSDDIWSENSYKEAIDFLEMNEDEIDFVSANVEFFGIAKGEHVLNLHFNEPQVIDVFKEIGAIRTNCVACIFKRDVLKDISFDARLAYWEDAHFICKVLKKRMKYGMVCDARYLYRKRNELNSATQSYQNNIERYVETLGILYEDLREYFKIKSSIFPKYIQTLFSYILAYRFRDNIIIPEEKKEGYMQSIQKILQCVDDSFILDAKNTYKYVKLDMLSCKYWCDIRKELVLNQGGMFFGKNKIFDLNEGLLSIWSISQKKGQWQIEGRWGLDIHQDYLFYALDEGKHKYDISVLDWHGNVIRKTFKADSWIIKGYALNVPQSVAELSFILEINGNKEVIPFQVYDKETKKKCDEGSKVSFFDSEGVMVYKVGEH